jgi:hypothetical protein
MGGNKNKFKASKSSNDVFSESDYNSKGVATVPINNEIFNSYTGPSSTLSSAMSFNNDLAPGSNSFDGPSRPRNDQQRNRSKKQGNKYDAM